MAHDAAFDLNFKADMINIINRNRHKRQTIIYIHARIICKKTAGPDTVARHDTARYLEPRDLQPAASFGTQGRDITFFQYRINGLQHLKSVPLQGAVYREVV